VPADELSNYNSGAQPFSAAGHLRGLDATAGQLNVTAELATAEYGFHFTNKMQQTNMHKIDVAVALQHKNAK